MSAVSIHIILRELAQAAPERPALIHGDETISRGQLDSWSAAIADHLAGEGVRAGSTVALQLDTSPELVATALGVLRLGAAYAVMEPQWSAQRLRRIDEILGGALSVTGPGRAGGSFRREIKLPAFDEPFVSPAREPVPVQGTDVATIFFTSGSTGEPKAVLSTHDATVRMFIGEQRLAQLDDEIVMAHLGSSAWDAFAFEVWGPLLSGGVSVLRQHRALSPEELRREISDHGVNAVVFTASLFNVLVDEDVSAFEGLRLAYSGGEAISSAHAARFLAAHPDIPLINGYGPAEATCFALMHRVTADDTRGAIPLGRPVSRTGVHVLDGERECGPDEVGELCVSGDGVSPGYLGDEALTAAKFVEVRIAGRSLRVYRTGDYGSKTASGVFTFAGRRDREVKVRGHRIDAGQIERTAAAFDGVAQCAVVPLTGISGRPESLALAVVAAGDRFDEKSLGKELRAALPPGWAPDTVVRLPKLPLTSNGKLDAVALHSAIVALTTSAPTTSGEEADLSDPIEAAFSRVLGGIPVDPAASLFELGGTSLAAVRLCTALSRSTGLSIPASVVLSHPSVNEMRAWIADQSVTADDAADTAASSPLTGTQSAMLFQHLDGKDSHNHTYMAWRITGPLDADRFVEALQDVHRRHPYLQGRYSFVDQAMWHHSELPATVERIAAPDEETALALLQDALDRPFSLADGEVWRALLCRLGEGDQWFLGVSSHHIAFDGWSVRIFVEDLAEAYRARCEGRQPRFALPVATPSEIYTETERVRGLAALTAQRDYWAKELAELPVGPAPWIAATPGTSVGVGTLEEHLTPEQVDLVHGRSIGAGLLPLLIAALGGALADVSGAEDLTIGFPMSQRSTPALQDTIACLLNTLCIRLRAANAPDTTVQAERAVLGTLRNSDLSLAEVARAAGLAGQTLFQVFGAVQDSPSALLRLDDCIVDDYSDQLPYIHLHVPLLVELVAADGIPSTVRVTYDSAMVAETMARNVGARVVTRLTEVKAG